jgi:hypothetical protein
MCGAIARSTRQVELGRLRLRVDHALGVGDRDLRAFSAAFAGFAAFALHVLRRLARDRLRALVGAQPVEHRVADAPSPVHSVNATSAISFGRTQWPFTPRGGVANGSLSVSRRSSLRLRRREARLVEAGADVAGVDEVAFPIVDAEQQRAETAAAALGIGVAADHELLAARALELDPRGERRDE